jgi:hypothetical protein
MIAFFLASFTDLTVRLEKNKEFKMVTEKTVHASRRTGMLLNLVVSFSCSLAEDTVSANVTRVQSEPLPMHRRRGMVDGRRIPIFFLFVCLFVFWPFCNLFHPDFMS